MKLGLALTTAITHGTTVLAISALEKKSFMAKGKGENTTMECVTTKIFATTFSEILAGI